MEEEDTRRQVEVLVVKAEANFAGEEEWTTGMAPAMRELCAGTARLSEEGRRQGLPVDQPEDVAYDIQYDLTNDKVIRRLKKEIAAGGIRYLPIATPCVSFSRWPVKTGTSSRTEADPWGQNSTQREKEANVLVWNVIGL